jgi:hypothetical protein
MSEQEILLDSINKVRNFASADLIQTLLTAASYTSPVARTLSYPVRIILNYLTHYATKAAFNPEMEEELLSILNKDMQEFQNQNRESWQSLHPMQQQHNAAPFKQEQPKKNDLGTFKEGHIGLIGMTRSGKTTTFIEYLLKNYFEEFESFFIVEAGLDKEQATNLVKAGLYNMRILHEQTENNEMIAYFTTDDSAKAISALNNMHGKKKLALFDDSQVNLSNSQFMEIAKYISVAKNANVQMAVSLHDPFDSSSEKKARGGFRYFVLFNVTENQFNRIQGLHAGN